jgi:D-alanine transaminase
MIYLNGQFLPLADARISPLDRGFLFGDGVYEFIPVYHGKAFLLIEHLQRLTRSLEAINMKDVLTAKQWADIIHTLCAQDPAPAQGIYLQITRGAGPNRQHAYGAQDLTPTVFAMAITLHLLSDMERKTGLSAITTPDTRWENCYIKSINLLPNILAAQQAYTRDACEAILLDNGYVTEGSSSNVFIVKNNMLITAPKSQGILWGITREFILQLAQEKNITCLEKPISESDLQNSDEIWITSSGREIIPITKLNEKIIGTGIPGPIWQQVENHYQYSKEKFLS